MNFYLTGAGLIVSAMLVVGVSLGRLRKAFVQGAVGPDGAQYLMCSACGAAVRADELACPHCTHALPSPAEIRAQWKMAKAEMRKRSRLGAVMMSLADASIEARIKAMSSKTPAPGVVIEGAPVVKRQALPPGQSS